MKKKALSLIVALCMVLTMLPVVGLASGDTTAEAYPVEGGNIYYTVSGDEITIVGADPAVTAAVIPEEIDGAWVVDIAPSAFTGNTSLRHVTIPGTISYLEEEAFRGCTSLVSASLMQGVYSIGKNAFYGCMSLYTLALPSTLAYVYQDATDNCGSLSCVYYEGSSDDWSDIYIEGITVGNRKLNSAQKVYGCRSSAVTGGNIYYKVDSGSANVVGADAGITALNIPGAINNYPVAINLAAFSNFITMESVVIGEGVTSIGGSAFSYCTSLKTVTLPLSLDSIGTNAFYNCIGLSTVYYAGDASDWAQMTIDGSNTDLTDANIINMKGVTSTCNVEGGRIYFNKTTGTIVDADNTVTAADIPAKIDDVTVTAIGKKAFEYCSVLKTVTIPEGVTLIDESAFLGCSSLASAAIPEYVTRIGGAAFLGCEALKTVTLPLNLTSIGTNAFYGCAGLSTVYYTGSESNWTALLNNIGDGNNALTGAQITYDFDPTSVPCAVTNGNIYFNMITGKIVGADNSITAAEIPAEINGTPVASIGGDVFRGCYSLESISLPSGIVAIEGIEDGAFESCKSLKSITVDPANTSYASDGGVLFNKNMTALVLYPAAKRDSSYTVPDTVTSIGAYAFAGSNNLDSITISENVALIGWKAFDRCRHLASITVDPENAAYSSEDGVLFDKLKTKLIRYPNGKTDTAYTVPDTVTAIGSNAFEGSWGLASVTVPEGVLTIGNNAFAGCGNLVQISLPASLTSIGDAAFNGCYALETVHYGGTADEWSALLENVGHSNDALTGADVYCFDPTSVPCAVTNGNIYFNMNTGKIVGADNSITAAEIPAEINGTPVASIGGDVFMGCGSLESISLPSGIVAIEGIEDGAFKPCESLKSITVDSANTSYASDGGVLFNKNMTALVLYPRAKDDSSYTVPDTVTSIGAYAFAGSYNLDSITISENVASIGYKAFDDCRYLASITVDPENAAYSSEDGVLFDKLKTELIRYPKGKTDKAYTVPDTVTAIEDSAFEGCGSFASVTVPEGVQTIGEYAFAGCTSLAAVTLPASLMSIGDAAFNACYALKTVHYGGTADEWSALLENVGHSNDALTGADVYCFDPTSVPCAVTNGNIYFNMNTGEIVGADNSITAAEIPAEINGTTVASIGGDVFGECESLESISLPSSIESIADGAFKPCESLKSITVDPANTSYASDEDGILFNKNMTALVVYPRAKDDSSYTVPDTVTSIGAYAFAGSNNLDSITISENVASIGYKAFDGCGPLASISVDPENAAYSSEDGVLFDKLKTELIRYPNGKTDTAYTVPDTVTAIEDSAFEGCGDIESVTVPEGVQTIGNNAFAGCGDLVQISLPASLTSIGDAAFNGCESLTTVNYGGTRTQWDTLFENIGTGNDCLTDATIIYTNPPPETLGAVNLTATVEGNAIVLTWDAVDGADVYRIYKQANGTAWSAVVKSTAELSYTDTEVTAGVKYYYTARAAKSGENFVKNPDQTTVTAAMPGELEALGPVEFTATASGKTVVLEWTAVTGADSYRIYREASGSVWEVIVKSTDGTSYIDDTVSMGVKYYYTMRAGRYNKFIRNENQMKTSVTVPVDLPSVPIKTIAWSESGAVLTWDKADDAESYRVYRKPDNGTIIWDIVESNITGTTYTDTSSLASGTKYYYKVRAGAAGKYPKVTGETAKSIRIP